MEGTESERNRKVKEVKKSRSERTMWSREQKGGGNRKVEAAERWREQRGGLSKKVKGTER